MNNVIGSIPAGSPGRDSEAYRADQVERGGSNEYVDKGRANSPGKSR